MLQTSKRRRAGFTLVELLVVLAIAGLIIALVAAGTIQVIAYSRTSTTQTTIQGLQTALNKQWEAVVEKAMKKDPLSAIPQAVVNLAKDVNGNPDPRRVRVIWAKLCLKREFPMNFSEALFPGRLPRVLDIYNPPLGVSNPLPTQPDPFPGSPTYRQFLRNVGSPLFPAVPNAGYYVPALGAGDPMTLQHVIPASLIPVTATQFDPNTWPEESSACLLMALKQSRNGFALTEDSLAVSTLGTCSSSNAKLILDAWRQPLHFYRWQAPTPYTLDPNDPSNLNNRDVDSTSPSGASATLRDPLDPEGTLLDPAWNPSDQTKTNSYRNRGAVWWFELYCHSVHEDQIVRGVPTYVPKAYYMTPTIVSAGRNNKRGLCQAGSMTTPLGTMTNPPPYYLVPQFPQPPYGNPLPALNANPYPSPLLPDLMDIDPGDRDSANDNIYSYRLRQGVRGD
jgi:prepilin-type N-terminal cleavage/methylation domain-containing protein